MGQEAIDHLDDDELSRRILDSAKDKGFDPEKYGISEPKDVKPTWTELVHQREEELYEEKAALVALIDDERNELERIDDGVHNLRYSAGVGISMFLFFGVVGMPIWLAGLIGGVAFGVTRMHRDAEPTAGTGPR